MAQPSGAFVVTNAWDAAGRWWVVGGTAGTFTYAYPAGSAGTLPISLTLPGGNYITNSYDALARLTRTELRTGAGALLNAHGYQYNLAHQRTLLGRTNSAYPTWNGYLLAGYDPAGQLTNAWAYKADGTPVTSEQWSYGYDAAQNLARRTNNTTVETFTVNALNQLTAIPNSTPSYDRRGNLVQRYFPAGPQYYWSYSYDAENQLTGVQTDTYYTYATYRFKVEFTYDGAGRLRIRRDYTWNTTYNQWSLSAETRYLYDGMLLAQERNGNNTPTVTYTRGRDLSGSLAGAGGIGGLLARSHGYSGGNWTSHTFYHADGNGNVTALVNSGGTLQASYKYDPYGRHLAGGGSLASANVLRFSSKPWVAFAGSTTSGLYYFGYRFYDPYLQRWVNRDPIGEDGSYNLYQFIANSPTEAIDPLGLDVWVIKDCSGLTPHRYIVGDNYDGTYWSSDFGPTAVSLLGRIYCPGVISFSQASLVYPGADGYCIEYHIRANRRITEKVKEKARQRSNDSTNYPSYKFMVYDCRHYACDMGQYAADLQWQQDVLNSLRRGLTQGGPFIWSAD